MTEKGYQSPISNFGMRHPLKPKCDLRHASLLPTLNVTKSKRRGPFLKENSRGKWLHNNQRN